MCWFYYFSTFMYPFIILQKFVLSLLFYLFSLFFEVFHFSIHHGTIILLHFVIFLMLVSISDLIIPAKFRSQQKWFYTFGRGFKIWQISFIHTTPIGSWWDIEWNCRMEYGQSLSFRVDGKTFICRFLSTCSAIWV